MFYRDIDIEGWSGSSLACSSIANYDQSVYFSGDCPTDWNEVFTSGKTIYLDSNFISTLNGLNTWFKSSGGTNQGITFQVNNVGIITNVVSCTSPSTPTGTPSVTPTPTPTSLPTFYTHGAVLGVCSNYCITNYNISTLTSADSGYNTLTIGDKIYGQSGAGFVAYSNISTDTTTGPFRIAEIDATGEVIGLYECSGGSCVPL